MIEMTDEQEAEYEALRDETIPDLVRMIMALRAENKRLREALGKISGLRDWAERWALVDEPCGGPHTTLMQAIDTLEK